MRPKFIYLHGFASSPHSATTGLLQHYYPQYEWIFPELNHHCRETLEELNALIDREKPIAVIGTSLGGFYSLYCKNEVDGRPVKKMVINPALYPSVNLKSALGVNKYFNPRKDGATEFCLEENDLEDFADTELAIEVLKPRLKNAICIFSIHDELLDYKAYNKYLFSHGNYPVKTIGHRLNEEFVKEELGEYLRLITDKE